MQRLRVKVLVLSGLQPGLDNPQQGGCWSGCSCWLLLEGVDPNLFHGEVACGLKKTQIILVVAFGKRLLALTIPLSSETLGLMCKRANLLSFFSTLLTYLSSDCSLLSLRLLTYTFLFFIYTSFPCAPVIFLSSHTGDGNEKEEIGIRRNSVPGKRDPAALSKACQNLSSVLETSSPAPRNPWSLERAVLLLNLGIRQEKLAAQSRTASGLCQNTSTKTSSLHLLCGGSSTFTFRFPAFHVHLLD